jgi:hypothetical protein
LAILAPPELALKTTTPIHAQILYVVSDHSDLEANLRVSARWANSCPAPERDRRAKPE